MNRLGLRTKVVDKLAWRQSFQSRLVLPSNKKYHNLVICIQRYKKLSLAGVKIEYSNFAYKKPLKNLLSGESQRWGANYVVYPVWVAVILYSDSFAKLASIVEAIVDELSASTFASNILFNLYESVWNVTDTSNKTYKNTVKSCTKNNRESTRWFSFISYNKVYRIAVYTCTRQLSWVKCCLRNKEGKGKKEERSLRKGILTLIKKVRTAESDVLKLNKEGVSQNEMLSSFFFPSIHLQIKSAKYNWTPFKLLVALQMFLAQLFSVRLLMAELTDFYFAHKEQKMLSFRHCSEEIKHLRKYNEVKITYFLNSLANYDTSQAIHIKHQGLLMIA